MCRLLMAVSLSLYTISVLLPWVIEYGNLLEINHVNRSWSFQTVTEVFRGNRPMDLLVWRFLEYWFFPPFSTYLYLDISRDWFLVFGFQMIVVVTGAVGLVKEKVNGKPLPLVYSTICSILTLILGYFQWVRQLELRRQIVNVFVASSVSFDMGYYLALISVILWLVSGWLHFHLTDCSSRDRTHDARCLVVARGE